MLQLSEAINLLKSHGYRVTKPRPVATRKENGLNAIGRPFSALYDPNYRMRYRTPRLSYGTSTAAGLTGSPCLPGLDGNQARQQSRNFARNFFAKRRSEFVGTTCDGVRPMRAITEHDLVLFTTNTGEFYHLHCQMARGHLSIDGWRDWIRDRVLPLYAKQVEPVTYDYETLRNAAREVRDYYQRHIQEL